MALPKHVQENRNELVDQVVKDIQNGKPFFWDNNHYGKKPRNLLKATKNVDAYYKGINAVRLTIVARQKGYKDSRWATFEQAKQAGGFVKKGEKGTRIEFWQYTKDVMQVNPETGKKEPVYVINPKTGEKERAQEILNPPMVKTYVVFNAEQLEGIEKEFIPTIKKEDMIDSMENMLKNSEAKIEYDQTNRNFYRVAEDKIHVMPREMFKDLDSFYATCSHEIAHSTGAKHRLDRNFDKAENRLDYAKEELRAELTSMFLEQKYNIRFSDDHYKNHAAYLQSWAKVLKDDPNELYRAASDAEKAMGYIETRMIQKNFVKTKVAEKAQDTEKAIAPKPRKRKYSRVTPKKMVSKERTLTR